jgi:hypothetical protein
VLAIERRGKAMTEDQRPVIPPPAESKPRKRKGAKPELTDDEWTARDARRSLRGNFALGLVFGVIGAALVAAADQTQRVAIGGGVRIDVVTEHSGGLYAGGLALLALGAICATVSVIGWGVSLGMRSAKDS